MLPVDDMDYLDDLRRTAAQYLQDMGERLDVDPEALDRATRKDERLEYTVEYAWEHSPKYREEMEAAGVTPEDIDGMEDIEKLPIIEADQIRENQPPSTDDYRFKADAADVRRPFTTSGSTGDPKVFFKSYDEMDRIYDDLRRGFEAIGADEDSVFVNYLPFVGLNPSSFYSEGGMEEIGLETVPISNTDYPPEYEFSLLESYLQDHDGTTIVNGLASHIDAKGRGFEEAGFDPAELDIDIVTLSGEPVSESRKDSIADVYDAEVLEFLGSTENGGFAYELPDEDGLQVIDDSVHVEVVDDDGQQVEDGAIGDLVVTNLLDPGEESAMPLVRYNIGDRTRIRDRDAETELGDIRIDSPHREGWEFVFGAVNTDAAFIEDSLYGMDELEDTIAEYQIHLDYDDETGRERMDLRIAPEDAELVGEQALDAEHYEDPETVAESVSTHLLDQHAHLKDTVHNVDAARLDVRFVGMDELELGKGKPQRLVDER